MSACIHPNWHFLRLLIGRIQRLAVIAATIVTVAAMASGSDELSQVVDGAPEPQVDFAKNLIPLFTRIGCNSGACHGAAAGRGYLQLSLYGSAPRRDYNTLLYGPASRFIDLESPGDSLVLRKPSGFLEHGGGVRMEENSDEFAVVRRWIQSGCPPGSMAELVELQVRPDLSLATEVGHAVAVQVTAVWSDSQRTNAASVVRFDGAVNETDGSDAPIVLRREADRLVIIPKRPGYWPITLRVSDKAVTLQIWARTPDHNDVSTSNQAGGSSEFLGDPSHQIDARVEQGLERIGYRMTGTAPAHLVARRLYMDLHGRHPAIDQWQWATREIEANRTERVVSHLLSDGRFADHVADLILTWVDHAAGETVLTAHRETLRSAIAAHLHANDNLQTLVREMLVLAQPQPAPLNLLHLYANTPEQRAELIAASFQGIRIGCARCHNHPLDEWTQDVQFALCNAMHRDASLGKTNGSRLGLQQLATCRERLRGQFWDQIGKPSRIPRRSLVRSVASLSTDCCRSTGRPYAAQIPRSGRFRSLRAGYETAGATAPGQHAEQSS